MVDKFDVIGIDEGQFYPDLITGVEKYVRKDKILIISALDGTFERKPFGQIPNLIPLCDDIVKLNAICMICGNDAPFTHRLGKLKRNLIQFQFNQKKWSWLVGETSMSQFVEAAIFIVRKGNKRVTNKND